MFTLKRTVDSTGSLIGNQDAAHPGLTLGEFDTLEAAVDEAREDYQYHQRKHLPVGPGCYYIVDPFGNQISAI